MAKLNAFLMNDKAVEDGRWMSPGEEFDDFEIQTRGFTDAYTDAKAAKLRRAAAAHGGDQARIPNAKVRDIVVDCLDDHVLLDVRNLDNPDGTPVTRAQFVDLLRTTQGQPFFSATLRVASEVGLVKADELETAKGN